MNGCFIYFMNTRMNSFLFPCYFDCIVLHLKYYTVQN
uniref:Uncharacterized protein n=1 Tax=Anguilla anguilla TaxID=7936 RepID=A0A0E9TP46_ANGAN